ncbi:MAG: RNA polymerase subunit sigma [Paludibacter sp.]
MIETKLTEIRYFTSDPKRMLNKFTVGRVLKSWKEDFKDEATGEIVTIERNEVLFDRGVLIGQDVLAQINFHLQAGDIKEVEVSNQRRMSYELEHTHLHPFIAQIELSDGKKAKFLFYSVTVEKALMVLKDWVELNYTTPFVVQLVKTFDTNIILIDNLRALSTNILGEEVAEEIDEEEYENQKKFYQIDFNVEIDGTSTHTYSAVVQTINVDRAMMLINDYLIKKEKKRALDAAERKHEYTEQTFSTSIEKAAPIPVGVFIPKEFSEAYQ